MSGLCKINNAFGNQKKTPNRTLISSNSNSHEFVEVISIAHDIPLTKVICTNLPL